MKQGRKPKIKLGLISLGLFFLVIPGVNVYDLLPDFVAYFIFAFALRYPAERAPYFSEAKDAFVKLAIVSIVKIPASLAMTFIRSSNVSDSDVRSLFALTFCVVEGVLLYTAVSNLFSGFT